MQLSFIKTCLLKNNGLRLGGFKTIFEILVTKTKLYTNVGGGRICF